MPKLARAIAAQPAAPIIPGVLAQRSRPLTDKLGVLADLRGPVNGFAARDLVAVLGGRQRGVFAFREDQTNNK